MVRISLLMREWLELLEAAGPVEEELLAMLVYASARSVEVGEEELGAARRRALLVHAAGGDLRRQLTLDARAAEVLAEDVDSPERRGQLADGLAALQVEAAGLPVVSETIAKLLDEPGLAWRVLAVVLLAEELGDSDD